jgi:hypothetical protein
MSHTHDSPRSGTVPVGPLELVGYWHAHEGDGLPHPQQLRQPRWEWRRRRRIVRYLLGGTEYLQYRGWSHCRFGGLRPNGSRDLTDGTWVWPEGLAHYVRAHGVRLPDEFVAHMAAHDFRPPPPASPSLHSRDVSDDFWRQWAARQGRFRPIAFCWACNAAPPSPVPRWLSRLPGRTLVDRLWYHLGWRR